METTETEVKDHHDGTTLIVCEREMLAGGIAKFPLSGRNGFPAEGSEGVEIWKRVFGGIVWIRLKLGAPVLGQTQAFGDGSEA